MYLNFYGLTRQPFHITSDPSFLYPGPSHREAMASILYALQTRKGFISLTGEVGTGKSTIVRSVLQRVNRDVVKPIYVFNANVTFPELLRTILQELGRACEGSDVFDMVQTLHEELIRLFTERHVVILVIDEAQNMPVETLENLRMLSNLETTREKLIQIVLVGQPELEEKLNRHELRQLNQRLALRATIRPMNSRESKGYLDYRLRRAGSTLDQVFTPGAIRQLVRHGRGNPRIMNILADNILVTGYGYQVKPIPGRIASDVIKEYFSRTKPPAWQWRVAALAACMLLVAILIGWPYQAAILNRMRGGRMTRAAQSHADKYGRKIVDEPSPIADATPPLSRQ